MKVCVDIVFSSTIYFAMVGEKSYSDKMCLQLLRVFVGYSTFYTAICMATSMLAFDYTSGTPEVFPCNSKDIEIKM